MTSVFLRNRVLTKRGSIITDWFINKCTVWKRIYNIVLGDMYRLGPSTGKEAQLEDSS
jgi:hypothetical protein